MLIKFEEVICTSTDSAVSYYPFAVRIKDIIKVTPGGIVQLSGEHYTNILVECYDEGEYTTNYKVLGKFEDIFNMCNTLEIL